MAKISQYCEMPPMCAAGGKIILTLVFHTILYHHLKFHEIIFQIDKTTVISASPPIFPPKSPLREIYDVNFHTRPAHLSMTVDIYIYQRVSSCHLDIRIVKTLRGS